MNYPEKKNKVKKRYFVILSILLSLTAVYFGWGRQIIHLLPPGAISNEQQIPRLSQHIDRLFIFYIVLAFALTITFNMREQIKRVLNIEYLVLFASAGILISTAIGFYPLETGKLFLLNFIIISIGLYCLWRFKVTRERVVLISERFISSRLYCFAFSLSLLLIYFFYVFPLKEWGSYIIIDDYPVAFVLSKHGMEILKQGGYFGWDSSFVGGYFTASEMGANLSHILLPFSFFGLEKGFHLMLLVFFLCFPLLCFSYVKTCCKVDSNKALVVLPIAALFVLHFFRDIFGWGMVSTFIGIDFTILSLILFQKLRENKRYSFFLLTLILSVLFYTHLGMFFSSVLFIVIDLLITPSKKDLKYGCYLGGFLLITALPFLIYEIKYPDYLILDNLNYIPAELSLSTYLLAIAKNLYRLFDFISRGPYEKLYYPLFFLPVLIYLFNKKAWRKQAILALFIVVFYSIIPPSLYLLFSRIKYLTPFLLSVLLSGFLITNHENKNSAGLLLVMSLTLVFFCISVVGKPYVFNHVKPGDLYNKPLVEKIKTLDGRYIAVENNQHWNSAGEEVVPSEFHWLPLLQLETNKLLFSNMQEGYHHSPYRANSFEGGFFRGRVIDEWAIEDINNILSKWGIKYLVVWNKKTRGYFNGYPQFFENIWQDNDWNIFRFKKADIRSAVVDNGGEAVIIDNDFFEKQVMVSNVKKDSKVTLRTNYFPAWKAYFNNKEVELINFSGQMGFIAPESGDYKIELRFPRNTFLNILAVFALMLSGFLSYKRILP